MYINILYFTLNKSSEVLNSAGQSHVEIPMLTLNELTTLESQGKRVSLEGSNDKGKSLHNCLLMHKLTYLRWVPVVSCLLQVY